MSWFWRTKPRSIIKTLQWFPSFASLEGQNWNQKSKQTSVFNQKKIFPTRRAYIYAAHQEEDSWLSGISFDAYLSGQKDQKETESNGRNDKATYEFFGFGYVDKAGTICVTDVGRKIIQGKFDQERYLKQLLKLHLPNPVQKITSTASHPGIFPMEIVLKAFAHYDSLNRSELALLFGCDCKEKEYTMLQAIGAFKKQYAQLENKLDTKSIRSLFTQIYEAYYGPMENKADSFYDYAEALSRSLAYTGLFQLSGRSIATKVRVATHAKKKIELLQRSTTFSFPKTFTSIKEYMDWYGSDTNIQLPWERPEERLELVQEKLSLLQSLVEAAPDTMYRQCSFVSQNDLDLLFAQTTKHIPFSDLKDVERSIDDAITNHNEEHFIHITSKTAQERSTILEKYNDILANDDMSALWLEVNTWKSLVAIQGDHKVKRNFQIEEDLSPRSFAPGVGNTPDMELYLQNTILLPEVSLMTGVRQWEHEASSVIDHVMHFMEKEPEKQVFGLFLSSRIHVRTLWQFFLLNRESWLGKPIPVVPLTITQYVTLITYFYNKELPVSKLLQFLQKLSKLACQVKDYKDWQTAIEEKINLYKL